jgi:hypothetical protein
LPGRKLVFSNAPVHYSRAVLALLRVADLFDDVFSIEHMGYQPKPDRRGFLRLLRKYRLQPRRCVMVEGIKNGDVIELNFTVRERTDKYFIHDKTYTIQYRASTVVDISPRNTDPKLIPMYQRDAMKGKKAPMHTVKRFVAENLLPLQ